jgi:hypothetical protein
MYIVLKKEPDNRYPLYFEISKIEPISPWSMLIRFADEAVFRASRKPDFEISPDSSINLKICESAAHACNDEM